MELGYFTMPLHPPGSNITKTMDDDLEQLVFLDNLNHKEAWIGEHFTSQWENIWIVGDPDEVATKIRDLHQEVGDLECCWLWDMSGLPWTNGKNQWNCSPQRFCPRLRI